MSAAPCEANVIRHPCGQVNRTAAVGKAGGRERRHGRRNAEVPGPGGVAAVCQASVSVCRSLGPDWAKRADSS
jgi:hypothetical protein